MLCYIATLDHTQLDPPICMKDIRNILGCVGNTFPNKRSEPEPPIGGGGQGGQVAQGPQLERVP